MNPVIYKYKIPASANFTITMNPVIKYLDIKMQANDPVLYAIVDIDEPMVDHSFAVYATGNPVEPLDALSDNYLGTFMVYSGALVFHLFKR